MLVTLKQVSKRLVDASNAKGAAKSQRSLSANERKI